MNFCKGAFTPWQFFQIPVELMVKIGVEFKYFQDYSPEEREAFAYAISKASSLSYAAVVGLIAGPLGVLGAVIFWLAAEFVSYALRKVLKDIQ